MNKSTLLINSLRVLSWLPLPVIHGLGIITGSLMTWLPNKPRRIAAKNLQLCFPDLPARQRQKLLHQSMIESSKTLLEMGAMWFWPVERLWKLDKGVTGRDHIEKILSQGRGVIALTPHLGQWEFLGMLAQSIAPMTSLYRPPRMEDFDRFLKTARKRLGNTLAPTSASGVKMIFSCLKKGEMAGILPDQDPGNSGIFAPFFGTEANTMTLINKLAGRSNAGIVIAYAERLPWGQGFITHIHAVNSEDILNKDPVISATALNRAIEKCVLELPAQYQWIYKRFKKRPENEAKLY